MRVMTITSVRLAKLADGTVQVVANAEVPTSGWSQPRLEPWLYIGPPDDGIQDFDVSATEPSGSGVVLQVVSPLQADLVIPVPVDGFWGEGRPLRGVRVHGTGGAWVALLDEAPARIIPAGGSAWPWSVAKPAAKAGPGEDLVGLRLRTYHTSDVLDGSFVVDRANIELAPGSERIVSITLG